MQTETESNWDEKDFLKSLFVTASDSKIIELEKQQFRDKAHHLGMFPKTKIPKTFNLDYVKTLDYKSRLKYVSNCNKLPQKTAFDMQMEASKFFWSIQTKVLSGSLGRNKIERTLLQKVLTRKIFGKNLESTKLIKTFHCQIPQ